MGVFLMMYAAIFLVSKNFIHLGMNWRVKFHPIFLGVWDFSHSPCHITKISGHIPKEIGVLDNLEELYLAREGNSTYILVKFAGIIPPDIGNIHNLKGLFMENNQIMGSIPREIGNLTMLNEIYLHKNFLTGMDLEKTISNLQELGRFHLPYNNFNGSIPAEIFNISTLRVISLGFNLFTGNLPSNLGSKLPNLEQIQVDGNYLGGLIPASIANCSKLTLLSLAANQFSGSIPNSLGDLTLLLYLGTIASEIGNLANLLLLALGNNKLTGVFPTTAKNLQNLRGLSLSRNNISGTLDHFCLQSLTELYLYHFSWNPSTCHITIFRVRSQSHWRHFNPSDSLMFLITILSGEIPFEGPFKNFTSKSFISNGALCGDSKFHKEGASGGTTMVVVSTQERVSHYELLQATDGYNKSNLLGIGSSGSVYKGTLNDGRTVAVKVFNLQLEGALKSFDVECEVLRNLRHRNLVKVISSCSNQDFKALVLEYMSNGSPEKWLYSENYFLDILQRLNVMIDVASALQYLHQEYLTPVVHCDLKPSDVLFDEDMVDRVSDFGIAKLLGKEESFALTKTFATIGYIALLLLFFSLFNLFYFFSWVEFFTRRRPSDETFAGQLNLKSWLECIGSLMKLASNCARDSPNKRLSMKEVLEAQKKIKLKFLEGSRG
ncbi:unnamed protein product [Coffea canephora]|uniref:Protein kinase domain-containing protein n=1 Tax=Coffea canephora TaxID=49390 RepID=A0A068UKW6_COFCA|nr:unnamed protein product [Coffea canephora]